MEIIKCNYRTSFLLAKIGFQRWFNLHCGYSCNHDGDLNRAKDLIYKAAEAGANAAKFQHFQTETIVSDVGFKSLEVSNHIKQNGINLFRKFIGKQV